MHSCPETSWPYQPPGLTMTLRPCYLDNITLADIDYPAAVGVVAIGPRVVRALHGCQGLKQCHYAAAWAWTNTKEEVLVEPSMVKHGAHAHTHLPADNASLHAIQTQCGVVFLSTRGNVVKREKVWQWCFDPPLLTLMWCVCACSPLAYCSCQYGHGPDSTRSLGTHLCCVTLEKEHRRRSQEIKLSLAPSSHLFGELHMLNPARQSVINNKH